MKPAAPGKGKNLLDNAAAAGNDLVAGALQVFGVQDHQGAPFLVDA